MFRPYGGDGDSPFELRDPHVIKEDIFQDLLSDKIVTSTS